MAFIDIHENIYKILIDKFNKNKNFVFRARKTNRANKLSKGYWFLGNDEYLVIGFWEGINWMNKSPNISFCVNYEGNSFLFINTSDDKEKTKFVERYLKKKLNLKGSNGDYSKTYSINNEKHYLRCLEEFLDYDWKIIDIAIREVNQNLLGITYPISLISREDCEKNIGKVEYYRNARIIYEDRLRVIKPSKILSFEISNYGPIKNCSLLNIPTDTQWIFLTGENGVGKSSVLKALATALGHRPISQQEIIKGKDFRVHLNLIGNTKSNEKIEVIRLQNNDINKRKPNTIGFAAYGPMRLQSLYGGLSSNQLEQAKSKTGSFNSLFNNDGYLLDLESEFVNWKNDQVDFSKREEEIKEFLENVLLNVGIVKFSYDFNNIPITLFQEIDDEGKLLPPVGIDKLSSGYLSIVAMMSDMLIRLYKQQPFVKDLADLEGVVLIDEIDIHLHPKFQKHFIEQLTETFPNIQFVVTTHSPLPFLGAPKSSVMCVIRRRTDIGVSINRVDDKIYFQDLLPNTILTSPIFGMDNITNESRDKGELVRTDENFAELEFSKKLESKINQFMTDEKENELIELFKTRRQ